MSTGSAATDRQRDAAGFFDTLFLAHHETVLRYCVRRLGTSEAEDAAADVFAVIWRRLDEVPDGDGTRAWLIGVAYKVVGNRFRSHRRRARLFQLLESEHKAGQDLPETPELDTYLIRRSLGELSASDQELIGLSSWDDLSRAEIAQVLGIRVNAVDQRLHRARSRLKARFDAQVAANKTSRPEEASL